MTLKVNGKVLEGSVLVNLLSPAKQITFEQCADTVFVPKVTKELRSTESLHAVFDSCKKGSLKAITRQRT